MYGRSMGAGVGPLAGEATYTVSQLNEEIRQVLGEAFPPLWVVGEAQRMRSSQRGHLYFELVEKGRGDQVVGRLDAVIWRTDYQRIQRRLAMEEQRLGEGQEIRCLVGLDVYPPSGRLQAVVRDVDPLFTLGRLEQRRRKVLAFLAQQDLLERNGELPLTEVPMRIGLVTSEGSAAYHDVLTGLQESGFGFHVTFVHASTQGAAAQRDVPSALALLATQRPALDAVLLVRGGGAKSDLAAFDSRAVAEAVARCPLPVLTGLGHEIDQSIADRVSHRAFKTPTMGAEFLVERLRRAEQHLQETADAIGHRARQRLQQAALDVQRSERLAQVARFRVEAVKNALVEVEKGLASLGRRRLDEARRWLDDRTSRLTEGSQRSLERRRPVADRLARRLADLAAGRLAAQKAALDGMARVCHEMAPERILERGFSMTQDETGRIVRHPQQVRPGDLLVTRLAEGQLTSRVEES